MKGQYRGSGFSLKHINNLPVLGFHDTMRAERWYQDGDRRTRYWNLTLEKVTKMMKKRNVGPNSRYCSMVSALVNSLA